MTTQYEPKETEKKWYDFWENQGFFKAGASLNKPTFAMVIPPPNITGSLHMGHALNSTIQDIIARFMRMDGYDVLWLPGTDHAGIATQNVVERNLAERGLAGEGIGRENFIKEVWKWKDEYGNRIVNQLKRLGASCDWSRQRFTLDSGLSKAVNTVFKKLYDDGLIYKANYMINWCPHCHTAISDIEVEYEKIKGHLWYIKYPIAETDDYIIVATTRPETMPGDTAIAVNPKDPRYKKYIGKSAVLPLVGKKLPVIADEYVDMQFGTGALKITPAHDPYDFDIGRKHNLPSVVVIDSHGYMNVNAGEYNGLRRYECRTKIVEDLRTNGFLKKTDDYNHSVGTCYRCHTDVEPYISDQWFVKMKPLAKEALAAVKNSKVKFIPKFWENTYFSWLNNIRDWCISRQIWWGHRIPVWYCSDCSEIVVSTQTPEKCPKCGSTNFHQESDVLDTWFSSALWPFSTLGWPDKTDDLSRYYPTSVLSTGFDIIYFWVARMIMMGIHFMGDVPFKKVYIHALIRDKDGQKMSKSIGNVIDPIDVIEKYGTDSLRLTLTALAAQGRDIRLDEKIFKGYRNFVNKLWNAARFIISNTGNISKESAQKLKSDNLNIFDEWIVSRLQDTIKKAREYFDKFGFNDYALTVYEFVWHQFCDWYLEFSKFSLYYEKDNIDTKRVLLFVFDKILKLLHPVMPFITESIWQDLPIIHEEISIMITGMPKFDENYSFVESEKKVEKIKGIITAVRNVRSIMNIPYSKKVMLVIKDERAFIKEHLPVIEGLTLSSDVTLLRNAPRPVNSMAFMFDDIEGYVILSGVADITAEKKRLAAKIAKIEVQLKIVEDRLNNPVFLKKAPPLIVKRDKKFYNDLNDQCRKLRENINNLR